MKHKNKQGHARLKKKNTTHAPIVFYFILNEFERAWTINIKLKQDLSFRKTKGDGGY